MNATLIISHCVSLLYDHCICTYMPYLLLYVFVFFAYLDDKIDKLTSSENISDIKALVQEQSNLILKLTETVNSQKERTDKLEESLIECGNSLEVSKTVSSRIVKRCDI